MGKVKGVGEWYSRSETKRADPQCQQGRGPSQQSPKKQGQLCCRQSRWQGWGWERSLPPPDLCSQTGTLPHFLIQETTGSFFSPREIQPERLCAGDPAKSGRGHASNGIGRNSMYHMRPTSSLSPAGLQYKGNPIRELLVEDQRILFWRNWTTLERRPPQTDIQGFPSEKANCRQVTLKWRPAAKRPHTELPISLRSSFKYGHEARDQHE